MERKPVELVIPSVKYKESYLEMLDEWKQTGEELTPWPLTLDPSDFPKMVGELNNFAKGIGVKPGWVASTTRWLIDSSGRVVGAVNIRHELNEFLRGRGGHIGYGVRPSERRKGYASEMLRQAIVIAREIGIKDVMLSCDKHNTGSAKTILKNGGVLHSEDLDNGIPFQRYWIY